MAKKPEFSIEFDTRFKDFKFTKELFFKGANKPTKSGWKKLRFTYHVNKKGYGLVSATEMKIDFHFILEMHPDLGEINFDGECILESSELQKVRFTIQNAPAFVKNFIDKMIIRTCYYNAEKIWKRNGLILPSVDIILRIPLKKEQ